MDTLKEYKDKVEDVSLELMFVPRYVDDLVRIVPT